MADMYDPSDILLDDGSDLQNEYGDVEGGQDGEEPLVLNDSYDGDDPNVVNDDEYTMEERFSRTETENKRPPVHQRLDTRYV